MNRARISIVCICCILATVFTVPATVFAEPEQIFYEDFEGVTPASADSTDEVKTAAMPTSMKRSGNGYANVEGTYSYVVEADGEQYLEINDNSDDTSTDTAGIEFTIPADKQQSTGKVTLYMRTRFLPTTQHGFMINTFGQKDGVSKQQMSVGIQKGSLNQNVTKYVDEAGEIKTVTSSVPIAKGLTLEQNWAELTFVLDLDSQTMDTYVGEAKQTTVDFRHKADDMTGVKVERIQIVGCNKTANPKQLLLDDIAVYNGEKLPGTQPEEPDADETLLFDLPFDTAGVLPEGIKQNGSFSNAGDKFEVVSNGGRTYLDIIDTSFGQGIGGQGFEVSIPMDKRPTSGKMTISADVFMDDPTKSKAGFMFNAIGGRKGDASATDNELSTTVECDLLSQNVSLPSFTTTKIAENIGYHSEWKTLTFILDLDARKIDYYCDGTYLGQADFRWKDQNAGEQIKIFQIVGRNNVAENIVPKKISIDNLKGVLGEVIPEGGGTEPEPPAGGEYLLNEDFEKDTVGQLPSAGSLSLPTSGENAKSKLTVETKESLTAEGANVPAGGNDSQFVRFTDWTTENKNMTWSLPFAAQTGKLVVEYDLCIPTAKGDNSKNAILTNINGEGPAGKGRGVSLHQWQRQAQSYANPGGGGTVTNVFSNNDDTVKGDAWQHYKIIADYPNKSFTIEIDGKLITAGDKGPLVLRDTLPDDLKNLNKLNFAGATIPADQTGEWERTAYIDNIKAYDFDNPPEEETPDPEPEPEPEGYLVFEDFQNMTLGEEVTSGTIGKNTNSSDASEKTEMVVAQKPGEGFAVDDYCMKFSDFTKNKGNSNIIYTFPAQTGKVVLEFDAYKPAPPSGQKGALLLNLNDTANTPGMALYFDTTNIRSYRGGLSSDIPFGENDVATGLTAGVWRSYKFIVDYQTKTFTTFIDGEQVGGALPVRLDSITDLQRFMIAGCTTDSAEEHERTGYFDNIKIYVPQDPEIQSVRITAADGTQITDLDKVPASVKSIDVAFKLSPGASIDETTLTAENIVLTKKDGTAVGCSYVYDKETNVLHITLAAELETETQYTLSLSGIADSNGVTAPDAEYTLTILPPDLKATVSYWKDGTAVTSVNPGDTVTATAVLQNNTDASMTLHVIFTAYCDQYTSAVKQMEVTVPANGTKTVDIEQTMAAQGSVRAAVYFWDAMDTMGWMAQRSEITQ